MPPRWSPYGTSQGELGEDWGRVLAHELGHYLFFIPDNYLGVDTNLNFNLTTCPFSLMDNPYLDQGSEFLANHAKWQEQCSNTLQNRYLGRSDWGTILVHYPMLNSPSEDDGNLGPNTLPIAVTQIEFVGPTEPVQTIDNHFFPLQDSNNKPLFISGGRLSAALWKNVTNADPSDDYIIDLGSTIPSGNSIEAWGAEPGDRLCAVDRSTNPPRYGCIESIGSTAPPLTLESIPNAFPEIQFSHFTTNTIVVSITNKSAENAELNLQLITPVGSSSPLVPVIASPGKVITKALDASSGAFYGHISVGLNAQTGSENKILRSVIPFQNLIDWSGPDFDDWGGPDFDDWGGPDFDDWGGPDFDDWGGPDFDAWGGKGFGWGGKGINWGGKGFSWGAPTSSEDAQVSIFPLKHIFDDSLEYTIDQATFTDDLPAYLTQVGQGYHIRSRTTLPNKAAILFNYLSSDVLGGGYNEQFVQIYYRPFGENSNWEMLDTEVDDARNFAVGQLAGEGTYLLALTQPIGALNANEINLITWPVHRPISVTEALFFIDGKYKTVYHPNPDYFVGSQEKEWLVYSTEVDEEFKEQVNSLQNMTFGSYWIWMQESVDPLFIPVDYNNQQRTQSSFNSLPPMIIYGYIDSETDTQEGDPVIATIDNVNCGHAKVIMVKNKPAFVLEVAATSLIEKQCGSQIDEVALSINGITYPQTLPWDNSRVQKVNLNARADLRLALHSEKDRFGVDEQFELTITYRNEGQIAAHDSEIRLLLPPEIALDGPLPAGCITSDQIICALDTIPESTSNNLIFTLKAIEAGSFSINANISSAQEDFSPVNNLSGLGIDIFDRHLSYFPWVVTP